jgi:signal transduction histidine kinase
MVLLLIASFIAMLVYLSRINSYVERHLRIMIPGMVVASEMLRNIGDMQTAMHHVLHDEGESERAAGLDAVAEIERRTFTTLNLYQGTHATRTHPVLYDMLSHHGRVDLAEQEDRAVVAIADGLTSLRAHREQINSVVPRSPQQASADLAYEQTTAKTADAITSLIEIHRKIDVEIKLEGDRLLNQARLTGVGGATILGFLIVAVYLMMQRYVAVPLKGLAETADRVAHDDYAAQFGSWPSRDEVGVLADSLSTMLTSLRERGAALIRKTKELESFSYSIAHDLKGPLREIEGFSSLLEKQFAGSGDQEKMHHIDIIRKSSLRLTHMIDALLKYSRLEQQELPRVHFNLVEMIGGLVTDLERQLLGMQPKITINLPFVDLYGEPISIRQAIGNVLDNAVKFSRYAVAPVIDIGGRQTVTERILWVRDHGIGFDESQQEKIFGLFERLHSPSEYEGTGVGLAIVKMVVEKHGGRVWAESVRGQGSTFYLAFPDSDRTASRPSSAGSELKLHTSG